MQCNARPILRIGLANGIVCSMDPAPAQDVCMRLAGDMPAVVDKAMS